MNLEQKRRPTILFALLTGIVALLALFFPILLLILPAMFAYLAAVRPWSCFLPALVIAAVGTALLSQWPGWLHLLVIYLPASVLSGILLRRGVGRFEITAVAAALIAAGFYVLLCVPSLTQGLGPVGLMQQQVQEMIDSFRALPAQLTVTGQEAAGAEEYVAAVTAALNDFRLGLPTVMPAILCLMGSVGAVISVPLAATWCARADSARFRAPTRFVDWRLPRGFVVGALILAVGSGVMALLELDIAQTVWTASLVLILLPLFVQGLCTLLFVIARSRGGKAVPIVVLVLAFVLAFPFVALILTLLGAVEQAFQLRRRIREGNVSDR